VTSTPGEPAWAILAPEDRVFSLDDVRSAAPRFPTPGRHAPVFHIPSARPAATLVLLVEHDGEAAVVLTKRPSTMRYHKDDWVMPGGTVVPGVDADAASAARREAEEELGVPSDAVEIVAQLDSHGPILTGFTIDVFLGIAAGSVDLVPDRREVAEVAVVPLSRLLDPAVFHVSDEVPAGHDAGPLHAVIGERRPLADMPFFTLAPGMVVWGMQGCILQNLLVLLLRVRQA
jgi:8-oxo-dGTP pyrophosphatase MutT (NUDIX family)